MSVNISVEIVSIVKIGYVKHNHTRTTLRPSQGLKGRHSMGSLEHPHRRLHDGPARHRAPWPDHPNGAGRDE